MMDQGKKAMVGCTVAIPVDLLDREALAALRMRLSLKKRQSRRFVFGSAKSAAPDSVEFFQMGEGCIHVPRKFGIAYAMERGIELDDRRSAGTPLRAKFDEAQQLVRPDLKPRQDKIVAEVVDGLLATPHNSGILRAGTGAGKTVMAVKAICEVGRRALIVVHNESLLDQWRWHLTGFPNGRPGFTDLKEADIGYIWQGKHDVSDKKIVLCMIQTLVRREFSPKERKAFGMVVFDEAHHLPADVFSRAMLKFDAKFLLGLSATPDRFDGLDVLLAYGLGETLNREVMGPQLLPEVFVIRHPTKIAKGMYMVYSYGGPNAGQYKPSLARLVNAIVNVEGRNDYLVALAVRSVRKGRKTMVFSDRLIHLERMKAAFDTIVNGSHTSAMFVGGLSKVARESAKQADILWCTYRYASEGIDLPDRDCLILGTPKTYVRQVVGRILRSIDGKKSPIVLDILDIGVPELESMCASRAREYKAMSAVVHVPILSQEGPS